MEVLEGSNQISLLLSSSRHNATSIINVVYIDRNIYAVSILGIILNCTQISLTKNTVKRKV